MNISQVKSAIGIPVLNISRQVDEQNLPQPWVSHWDDTNRVRVTMHDDVYNIIVADKSFDKLAYKTSTVTPTDASKLPYTRIVIITPKELLGTL